MSTGFDPYHEWLGISPKDQPPNHYRLLGIELFESKATVIDNAADRQMAAMRTRQSASHAKAAQQLLNEIAAARVCLLNEDRKSAYDAQLKEQMSAASSNVTAPPPPPAATLAEEQPETEPAAPVPVGRPLGWMIVLGGCVAALLLCVIPAGVFAVVSYLQSSNGKPTPQEVELAASNDEPALPVVSDTAPAEAAPPTEPEPEPTPPPEEPEPTPPAAEPAPAPEPVEPPPEDPGLQPGDIVDLFPLIKPLGNTILGEWDKNEERLRGKSAPSTDDRNPQYTVIELPHDLPPYYSLSVEVERISGDGWFGIALGLNGDRHGMVVLDRTWRDDTRSGLELVDGEYVTRNQQAVRGAQLNFQPATLTCNVGDGAITATLNEEPLVDWKGSFTRLSLPRGLTLPNGARIYLVGSGGEFDVTSAKLTVNEQTEEAIEPVELADIAPPIARWTFNTNLQDNQGQMHGSPQGTAYVADGKLVLDGEGYVVTNACPVNLVERSLELWVTASDVEQQNVAAMSLIQPSNREAVGEGIGFATKGGVWTAVNTFRVFRDFGGPAEVASPDNLIHLVLVCESNGRETLWRNGKPYGWPHEGFGRDPLQFRHDATQVVFGRRSPTTTETFKGSIDQAQLYDRALSPGEIATLSAIRPIQGDNSEQIASGKRSVPEGAVLAAARERVSGLYDQELLAARTPQLKLIAAERVLSDAALRTGADQYAFYEYAAQAFGKAGQPKKLLEAVDLIASIYDFDPLPLKVEGMTEAGRLAGGEQAFAVSKYAAMLVDEALSADNFEAADAFVSLSQSAARSAKIAALSKAANEKQSQVEEAKAAYLHVEAALERLKVEPENTIANLVVGKYFSIYKQDWEAGAPYLARGNDKPLQLVAEQELARPTEGAAQLSLADAWWRQADAATGVAQQSMQARAAWWYRMAAPRLEGIQQQHAKARILELRCKQEDGWLVLFRGDSALYWDSDVDTPTSFAIPLSMIAEEEIRFLRIRRMDTGEEVIVPLTKEQFLAAGAISPNVLWASNRDKRSGLQMLGIASAAIPAADGSPWIAYEQKKPYGGWGFGAIWGQSDQPVSVWAGAQLFDIDLEIAVKNSSLDVREIRSVLKLK